MAGGRGGLGWLVLIAALAVPSFLFYNWWSHQKAEHDRGLAVKARSRLPQGGVFQTPSPASDRLVNPISSTATAAAPATSTAAVAATSAAPAPAGAAAVPVPAGAAAPSAASGALPPPSAAALPAASASAVPAAMSAPAAAPGAVSASSGTTIVLPRDPMMSPLDLVRIREAEAEKERIARQIWEAAHRPKPKKLVVRKVKRVEPPIEDSVELQGIVARPDGDNMAIVNNATVNPGDTFSVDGRSGRVRIVRISAAEVLFEYKKHFFKKTVNAE
jgi:hypothetical protein